MNIKNERRTDNIEKICIFLFQVCVIVNNVFGFDVQLYTFSKLCLFIFFAFVALWVLMRGKLNLGKSLIAPALFMLLTGASCLWASNASAATDQMITQLQLYVLFFFTYFLYSHENADVKKYLDALYISGIGLLLYSLYKYGWNTFLNGMLRGDRMGGEISNENTYGMVFSQAALVAFYYFIKSKKAIWKVVHIIAVVVFTFFALSSGSKKAFLMIFVGVIGICLLLYGIRKLWKALLIGAICIAALFFVLKLPVFSSINRRLTEFMNGESGASDVNRAALRAVGWKLFFQKPVFGYGIDNFRTISGFGSYAHDNFIEILVDVGIVGFIFYYIPYVRSVIWGWKYGVMKRNYVIILLFMLVCISLVFGYGMVQMYGKNTWILLGIMAGCLDNGKMKEVVVQDGKG